MLIISSFCLAEEKIQQYELLYSNSINCLNPSWAYDSRTFTVEDLTDNNYKLMLGRISDEGIGGRLLPIFNTKKQRGKQYKKRTERNAGWVKDDERFITLIAVNGGKDHVMKQIDIKTNNDNISREMIRITPPIKKQGGNQLGIFEYTQKNYKTELLSGQPRCFTPMGDKEFYFMNLASHNTILRTAIYEEEIVPIKGFDVGRDIGISSLSASSDGSKLLTVCYDNTFSEIYDLEIDMIKNIVISQNSVTKPDENLNFFGGIRYPDININKYALMGASETMSQNLVCKIFIVQDNQNLASLDGYYMSKDYDFYKRPIGQWIPETGSFFFLRPGNGGGELYFWNEQYEVKADLEISNIRDFEFSLDGKYLILTTQAPDNIMIYKVK